jgi:hypothetical protein
MEQWIRSAAAEKLAVPLSPEYLETRAKRGSRKKFEATLKVAPDVEPATFDRLLDQAQHQSANRYRKERKRRKRAGGSL